VPSPSATARHGTARDLSNDEEDLLPFYAGSLPLSRDHTTVRLFVRLFVRVRSFPDYVCLSYFRR